MAGGGGGGVPCCCGRANRTWLHQALPGHTSEYPEEMWVNTAELEDTPDTPTNLTVSPLSRVVTRLP